jgi:hypothetical protein
MSHNPLNFVVRKPRHTTAQGQAVEAWLERAGGRLDAELANFSRHGVGLIAGEPAEIDERVTLRIRHTESGLDLSLAGTVRWRRARAEGRWLLGCQLDQPVSLETLGELFLREILDAKPTPRG